MFFVPWFTLKKAYLQSLKNNFALFAWFHSAICEERIIIHQSFLAIFDLGAAVIHRVCHLYSAVVGTMLSFARDLGVSVIKQDNISKRLILLTCLSTEGNLRIKTFWGKGKTLVPAHEKGHWEWWNWQHTGKESMGALNNHKRNCSSW